MNENEMNFAQNSILIVDDTPHNLGILFDYLTRSGFKVFVAVDGETALEQVQYTQPDLILLDVMMPTINGFEVCEKLKSHPQTQDIPVIFMTALSDSVDKVRGLNMGAVDYITKPLQHEEVLSRVKTHLSIRNLQKTLQEKNEELATINNNLQKMVEEKTKQLINQEKSVIIGRLTQGIIHNIKNPLQVIFLCIDLLETVFSNQENLPVVMETLEKIDTSAEKINKIIEKLMRKSQGVTPTIIDSLNVNEVIKQELEFFQENLLFKNKVKKEIILAEGLPPLPLNSSEIAQVFDNLIDNALDAMWKTPEPRLRIVTRQDSEWVYIEFEDVGNGIPPENLGNIFEAFFTTKTLLGSEKKSAEPTGTGLGLYTCLEIIRPIGGDIRVKSEVGKGSIFTVVLPKSKKSG